MDERLLEQMKKQGNTQDALRIASETLDKPQQEKLRTLLADKQALTALLQSERAQALFRQLQK